MCSLSASEPFPWKIFASSKGASQQLRPRVDAGVPSLSHNLQASRALVHHHKHLKPAPVVAQIHGYNFSFALQKCCTQGGSALVPQLISTDAQAS